MSKLFTAAAAAFVLSLAPTLHAADAWKPFPVESIEGGQATRVEIQPLASAQKKWKLCVLMPHMKDSFWTAVDYGLVKEVQRLGLAATVLQAGGYDQLPKQVSQFDDCLNSGADAIIVGPISEAGLKNKFKAAADKGIPTIVFINPVADAPVTSKIFVDFKTKGKQTGEFLRQSLGNAGGKVVAFPGPQGSGWAESYLAGFKEAMAGSKVQLLDTKFGDAGVAEQLKLVEDSLQSYPEMTALWGTAPTAEAAIGAVADAGRKGMPIVASYENQTMLKAMNDGKILAFGTEFPVMQARVAVDLSVAALEKKPVPKHLMVVPQMISKDTVKTLDPTMVLAPDGFQPVFSVK
ncbi:MAG: TMAO reductase system periplasmic protein TorT [Xenophilus sp.]